MKKISWENLAFFLIVALALFLRFYHIDQYMTFLGDEGRDALIIRGILVDHHIPLLGPPTSIGNMYLGPLYYYMMAVPMAIFWLNPVAAAGMDALIGVGTVVLVYFFARKWFGFWAAFCVSVLYAVSPVTIFYSRSSWNPNPAPFFALLALLGVYLARQSKDFKWFILTGASLAFAVQMHYLATILLPIFVVVWVYELLTQRKKYKSFLGGTLGAIIAFLFLMSPLVIFDFRHNFMNFRAISAFFTDRQTTVNLNLINSASRIPQIYSYSLIDRYLSGDYPVLNIVSSILILIPLVWTVWSLLKKRSVNWPLCVLGVWLLGGVLGLSLYKQTIYDHYLGFLNPVPYLLLGSVFFLIGFIKKNWIKVPLFGLMGVLVIALVWSNLSRTPILSPPANELSRTQAVAKYIIHQSDNQPFNFALLSAHNYDSAYQYYLLLYNHKPDVVPVKIDKQLFVVCEDPVCSPINNPKYEIAAFGYAKIADVTEFDGVKVFKLVSNPTGQPSVK